MCDFTPKFRDSILVAGTKNDCFYTTRIKYFGDDYIKAVCFNRPVFNDGSVEVHKCKSELIDQEIKIKDFEKCSLKDTSEEIKNFFNIPDKAKREERTDSIKRSKEKCYEIAYANNFEFFVTLTINQEKLDRTDTKQILKKIRPLLSNLVQRKNFKYILIPELHERYEANGKRAIHFHGLCSGDLKMVDSGKVFKGNPVHNWLDWDLGYSTAIVLNDQKYICQYITKYITKENSKIFGKYYFSGGAIKRSVPTTYCNINYDDIEDVFGVEAKEVDIIEGYLKAKYFTIDNPNLNKEI